MGFTHAFRCKFVSLLGNARPVRANGFGSGQYGRVAVADEGTMSAAVPARPPRLTHEELRRAQADTLKAPRRRYGIAARILFILLDVVYGKPLTLSKFKVL